MRYFSYLKLISTMISLNGNGKRSEILPAEMSLASMYGGVFAIDLLLSLMNSWKARSRNLHLPSDPIWPFTALSVAKRKVLVTPVISIGRCNT